jgi:alginate O-acetyltransferase complex protein AlgI
VETVAFVLLALTLLWLLRAAMNFTDPEFAAFLVVTFCGYYLCSTAGRQVALLLAASLVFYAWSDPSLTLLLLLSATITCSSAYAIGVFCETGRRTLPLAIAGVVANLGVLAFYKYSGLLASGMAALFPSTLSVAERLIRIPLPIGISFYTFHGISMIVDAYRRESGAQIRVGTSRAGAKAFLDFWKQGLLYVVFFPQLVAGPIVRSKEFLPQIGFKRWRDIPWRYVWETVLLGYFLKLVVADNLHNQTFLIRAPYYADLPAERAWTMVFSYSIQIFADFAGYSLIAIGIAAMFGYKLPQNFNFPYLADSFSDFWRRWHISLSTWLRDYLYLPLGGNRRGAARTYLNLFLVMAIGGLWHGAALSYLSWGIYHGVLLMTERFLAGPHPASGPPKRFRIVRIAGVFLAVSMGWVFFKLPTFSDAIAFLKLLFTGWSGRLPAWQLCTVGFYVLPVVVWHFLHLTGWHRTRPWLRPVLSAAMVFLLLTNRGTSNAFIYFQF